MAQYVYTMRRVQKIVPPKREILKNISLNFFPGAKIGVLGLNGSGKSSLLKIMAGEDQNYEGEVVRMPNLKVGFLPQEPALDPQKTVRETVEESQGDLAAAKKRLDEVYAEYGAEDRIGREGPSLPGFGRCARPPRRGPLDGGLVDAEPPVQLLPHG